MHAYLYPYLQTQRARNGKTEVVKIETVQSNGFKKSWLFQNFPHEHYEHYIVTKGKLLNAIKNVKSSTVSSLATLYA